MADPFSEPVIIEEKPISMVLIGLISILILTLMGAGAWWYKKTQDEANEQSQQVLNDMVQREAMEQASSTKSITVIGVPLETTIDHSVQPNQVIPTTKTNTVENTTKTPPPPIKTTPKQEPLDDMGLIKLDKPSFDKLPISPLLVPPDEQ
jgi:type II secretory pathway pseudopilin PulG